MARVRRIVWVAAVVWGVFLVSLLAFLGHQRRDVEKEAVTEETRETLVTEGVGGEKSAGPHSKRAKPPVPLLPAEVGLQLSPDHPRLGETAKLTFIITTLEDEPNLKVWFRPLMGVAIVGGDKEVYCSMSKGETRAFIVDIKFLERVIHVGAFAGRPWHTKTGEEKVGYRTGCNLYRLIVDEETGQLGTVGEYLNSELEFRYDPVDGSWLEVGVPGLASWNRRIVEMMKRLEPAISDSEALCLHSEMYKVGIPPGVCAKWDEEKQEWIEDDIFRYYLQEGWLKAMREGGREKWQREQKQKIERAWERYRREEKGKKGGKAKTGLLLPGDSGNEGAFSNESVRPLDQDVLVTFDGRWRFRKHFYDTTGLQTEAVTKDIISAKARILATYIYNSQYWRVYSPYATTNDTGGFITQMDIPGGASNCNAYAVVFPSGPDPGNPRINVSDPYITIPDYWKDPDDPTLFPCREGGLPTPHPFTPDTFTKHLGTVFPDSFPSSTPAHNQPESGAVNIYETLLEAYQYCISGYMTPDTLTAVRALWEPGDTHRTGYRADTIWVSGDTLSPPYDTDEWDDAPLMHEYGHHVMNHCAQMPPQQDTIRPYWWVSDAAFPNTAYTEAWPDFFQAVVRDSIYYVETLRGIGGGEAFYMSVEDPWEIDGIPPDSFQGGPWCEGAVAGVLWDIYDSADEAPYPSYPAPGWPDTGLADTLSLGLDEIWNIFDDYEPLAPALANNCWHIYHFLSGWRSPEYDYGHETGMIPIFTHHRIEWELGLGNPHGLKVRLDPVLWAAHLTWSPPGTKQPLAGYCLYRKEIGDTLFERIAEPPDTSHTDTTVVRGCTYFYTVTAFDTLGIESDTSNVEWIWIPFASDTNVATAFNNAAKIAVDSNRVHLVFVSEGKICYSHSENQAVSWNSPDTIGPGKEPSLALDIDGNPHVVFHRDIYVFYARYDTVWSVYCLTDSPCVPISVRHRLPSFEIDPLGYGHVAWEKYATPPGGDGWIRYGYFDTQDPHSVTIETIDAPSDTVDWVASPSIALDSSSTPHVGWRRGSKGGIYYSMREDTEWTPRNLISQEPSGWVEPRWPCLDVCGNRLSAVWMAADSLSAVPDIYYRPKEVSWDTIEHVSHTADFSAFPVIVAGTYAVWAESLATEPYRWEIVGARRKPDGTWEHLGCLSQTSDVDSRYPQVAFSQDADTGHLYVAWTEGNSSPYAVMVRRFEVPRVPNWTKEIETEIEEGLQVMPRIFALRQNYPNPFHGMTLIWFQVPVTTQVTIEVYDVTGRRVRTLVDEKKKAGYYSLRWDGKSSTGERVASGVYFYRLTAGDPALSEAQVFLAAKKMVLMR